MKIKQSNQSFSKAIKSLPKKNTLASQFILLTISILSLFFESILIILSGFRNGISKKEILSNKTHLGFDLIIKKK